MRAPSRKSAAPNNALSADAASAAPLDVSARKGRILRYATKYFLTYGYAGTCIDDIAIDAGVSKKSIYRLFKDKLGLVTSVSEHLRGQLDLECQGITDTDAGAEEFLTKFGTTYVKWMNKKVGKIRHYDMTKLFMEISNSYPEFPRPWVQPARIAKYIEKRIKYGELYTEDPSFAASQYMAIMLHLAGTAHPVGDDSRIEKDVRKAVSLFLCGCSTGR